MKIAVWGAGKTGAAIVRRLVVSTFTRELLWLNRSAKKLDWRRIDIEHGLAYAPTCRRIVGMSDPLPDDFLDGVDALVVTFGKGVEQGQSREDCYRVNRKAFRETCIPALQNYKGFVVVVTNPVDVMARLLHEETTIPAERIVGLGTMVETARLRGALAWRYGVCAAPQEVDAIAIGTHDEFMVPVLRDVPSQDSVTTKAMWRAHGEVVKAADRVKQAGGQNTKGDFLAATMHPIAEGTHRVLEVLANNDSDVELTVSVRDKSSGIFFSKLCRVSASKIVVETQPTLSAEWQSVLDKGIEKAAQIYTESARSQVNLDNVVTNN